MNDTIQFDMYEITDELGLDEYVPGHFSGVIAGYPVTLGFFEAPGDGRPAYVLVKMNVLLQTEADRSGFAERFHGMFSESEIEKDLILYAYHINVEMDIREGVNKELKKILDVLPQYFKANQLKSGCARCGINDHVSLFQAKLGQAEFVCPMCKENIMIDTEKRLERLSENAIENKKKIRKASASFWVGATGQNILPALFFSLVTTFAFLVLMGFYFSQDVQAVIIGTLPTEITELSRSAQNELRVKGMGLIDIWRTLAGIAPVVGIAVFKFSYRILCRKGLLFFIMGHLLMHVTVLFAATIFECNKVISKIDFGAIPVDVALLDLPSRLGLFVFMSFIPLFIVYGVLFGVFWRNID